MSTMKIGMVGLDTSHCEAFVKVLHDEDNPAHVPGGRVVGAFPGGSEQFSSSRDRVAGITATLRDKHGIAMFDSIAALGPGMDAFFLESVDGRQHLEQFKLLAEFGKPVFIDKPLACSLADAQGIVALAQEKGVPLMSSSAIRFAKGVADLREPEMEVHSCEAFGPMSLLDDYPGFFWYGIHSADVLFSYMGKGCKSVRTIHTENADLIVGTWEDGRIGTLRGTRFEGGAFGCTLFTGGGVKQSLVVHEPPYYALMLKEVVPFMESGKSPVDPGESLETIGFLEAAEKSRVQGGEAVSL